MIHTIITIFCIFILALMCYVLEKEIYMVRGELESFRTRVNNDISDISNLINDNKQLSNEQVFKLKERVRDCELNIERIFYFEYPKENVKKTETTPVD